VSSATYLVKICSEIGGGIVKVDFMEFVGKRKKKVSHIEIKKSELNVILEKSRVINR